MKNRIIKKFLIIFFLPIFNLVSANDDFIFQSNTIEYKENQNVIIASGEVKINSSNGIDIFADKSKYLKL